MQIETNAYGKPRAGFYPTLYALTLTILSALSALNSLTAQDLNNGLVGYYTFCDCSGTDYSGNNRNGMVRGTPQCIRGILDHGLLLNQQPGINDCGQPGGQYIALPPTNAIWAEGFTVAAWIRFDNINSYERIIDFSNADGDSGGLPIWFGREGNSNNLTLESWVDANGAQARTKGRLVAVNAVTNGSIEYYCATTHGDTMRIFVNGVLVAQKLGNPIANVTRSKNYIGKSAWCADPDLKGFVDEVRIYNRALSAGEIASLYKITNVVDFEVRHSCTPTLLDFKIDNAPRVDSLIWNFGDAASGSLNTAKGLSVSHNFSNTGLFNVTVIGYKSCLNDTVRKQVRVENYDHFLGADESLCRGSKTLKVNYSGGTYVWQDGSTNDSFKVTQPGLYHLTVTQYGCTYSDTVFINSNQKFSSVKVAACSGESVDGHTASGVYTDTLVGANGCDSIRQLELSILPSATSAINATICNGEDYAGYTKTGNYSDTLVAANGCDSIRNINLVVIDLPRPSLGNDTILCTGDTLLLSPGAFSAYTWQNGSAQPSFEVFTGGRYRVEVANTCGRATDEILVTEDACNIYFPNAFTPNQDGRNDLFKILNAHNLENFRLVVFNRWGQAVFETRDYTKGWNGLFKGRLQNPGTFVWFCGYKMQGQPAKVEKGTVYLVR